MTSARPGCVFLALFTASIVNAQEFPPAPDTAAAAESAGMIRLPVTSLKSEFAGEREERAAHGGVYRAHYRADGGIELSNSAGPIDHGTFSVTGQNGGSVCLRLEKQMNQRMCAVWFAAPDGVHLFGYNPTDGKLRAVSRAAIVEH